jgi:hypothetical protein
MDSVIMEVLIDSGLLKHYTHAFFKYQSFNIIVYFKGDKVIIIGCPGSPNLSVSVKNEDL